jgi:hypothetical protein
MFDSDTRTMKLSARTVFIVGAAVFVVAATFILVYVYRASQSDERPIASQSQIISPQRNTSETTPSSHASLQERSENTTSAHATDWGSTFRESNDYLEFVSLAARAALDGNGRAAHFVDVALTKCAQMMNLAKTSEDPVREYLSQYTQTFRYAPQLLLDQAAVEARKCVRLGSANAFDDLPHREGGYPSEFWRELALAEKDPVAEAMQAQADLSRLPQLKSTNDRQLALDRLQHYVYDAVSSKDPEAIFEIGIALTNGAAINHDTLKSLAMSLAACDMGYDCSANNPHNYRLNCRPVGMCPEGTGYSEYLRTVYGETRYAEIYMQAQVFRDLLARGESEELDQFISIDSLRQ